MNMLTSFRAALVYRIVAGLGAASALASTGCGDATQTAGGTGGASSTSSVGGAGGMTTSGGTTSTSGTTTGTSAATTTSASSSDASASASASSGSGMMNVERCFSAVGGAPCPDLASAPGVFGSCTPDGEAILTWLSGPTPVGTDCCYQLNVTDPNDPSCGAVGRPFVVTGQARVAPVTAGLRGWSSRPMTPSRAVNNPTTSSPQIASLDEATRAELARAWASDAAFEHASVGSFGKLALELLSFGAPADLIRSTHEAALDEIGHAQMCFALASAYLGTQVGPGPLAEARSFAGASTLAELATAAVREGCFGETLAAVVASAQRAAATDPAVREVLAIVAEEESRHAELSFRVVAWAISAGGESVRSAVHGAFLEELEATRLAAAGARIDADGADATPLRAHGRLTTAAVLAERLRAAEEVVIPAMGHLLGEPV